MPLAHVEVVRNLRNVTGGKKVKNIIIASRPPSPFPDDFEQIELPPLEIDAAIELLPEHLGDGRKVIAQRLGGHPLALQLQ